MKRNKFLLAALAFAPVLSLARQITQKMRSKKPFRIDAGKSRFDDSGKFLGVHPNDMKISSKDTEGQLSVFEYTGLSQTGPSLHLHYTQDEIFYVVEGEYRFVVGGDTHEIGRAHV